MSVCCDCVGEATVLLTAGCIWAGRRAGIGRIGAGTGLCRGICLVLASVLACDEA